MGEWGGGGTGEWVGGRVDGWVAGWLIVVVVWHLCKLYCGCVVYDVPVKSSEVVEDVVSQSTDQQQGIFDMQF